MPQIVSLLVIQFKFAWPILSDEFLAYLSPNVRNEKDFKPTMPIRTDGLHTRHIAGRNSNKFNGIVGACVHTTSYSNKSSEQTRAGAGKYSIRRVPSLELSVTVFPAVSQSFSSARARLHRRRAVPQPTSILPPNTNKVGCQ